MDTTCAQYRTTYANGEPEWEVMDAAEYNNTGQKVYSCKFLVCVRPLEVAEATSEQVDYNAMPQVETKESSCSSLNP
jgi:hypothetical protein